MAANGRAPARRHREPETCSVRGGGIGAVQSRRESGPHVPRASAISAARPRPRQIRYNDDTSLHLIEREKTRASVPFQLSRAHSHFDGARTTTNTSTPPHTACDTPPQRTSVRASKVRASAAPHTHADTVRQSLLLYAQVRCCSLSSRRLSICRRAGCRFILCGAPTVPAYSRSEPLQIPPPNLQRLRGSITSAHQISCLLHAEERSRLPACESTRRRQCRRLVSHSSRDARLRAHKLPYDDLIVHRTREE